jgi:NTP pyrophosphatase (non-canonical NTP hydrolase)
MEASGMRTTEPSAKSAAVCEEVLRERKRQDIKWGEQNHDPFTWIAILGEEFGEVAKAAQEAYFRGANWQDYRAELIQTAAVCVAMVECFDRKGGKP